MVQAIVFLPLLGAILAGLIAIFGAHARNPSGDTVEHHHDDAHGAHAHAADGHSHDDHGHDDHHVSEPPAQGSRAAELITTGLLFVSAALSWVVLVDVGFMHHDYRIALEQVSRSPVGAARGKAATVYVRGHLFCLARQTLSHRVGST